MKKNLSGKTPNCFRNPLNQDLDKTIVLEIIKRHTNRSGIAKKIIRATENIIK